MVDRRGAHCRRQKRLKRLRTPSPSFRCGFHRRFGTATFAPNPRWSGRGPSPELPDFDEMIVRVAHVATNLDATIDRRREKRRAARAPFLVDGLNVRDANVEKARDAIRISWWLERHHWLVISRSAARAD